MDTIRNNALKNRRGAIMVLAAFCLIMTMAFLAFSVDWGYVVVTGNELQNAADAGALSGVRALSGGNKAAIDAAQLWVGKNVAAGHAVTTVASEDVEVGKWDKDTATFTVLPANSPTTPNAVRVTCRRTSARGNPLGLFFGRVLGHSSTDVSAAAIATKSTVNCGPFLGANYASLTGGSWSDSFDSSKGVYSRGSANKNGHVCSNGTVSTGGSGGYIWGDAHPGQGKTVTCSSDTYVSGSKTPLEKPISVPAVNFGNAATVNMNATIPKDSDGRNPFVGGAFKPHSGATVTLQPGTYYFQTLTLNGGSTIRLTGKTTIYVVGDVTMGGGSIVNPTALASNCQLYSTATKIVMGGGGNFYGVVYAPAADITWSGGSDCFGSIVGLSLTLGGGGGFHYDEALNALFNPQGSAKLVQ